MNSKSPSPTAEDSDGRSNDGFAGSIDIVPKCVSTDHGSDQSQEQQPLNTRIATLILPAAQLALGTVLGFVPCVGGWLFFVSEMSNRHVASKADLIIGFLSSAFFSVLIVLAIQGAMTIFLIHKRLQFAAIGGWLVYLPFSLFFMV